MQKLILFLAALLLCPTLVHAQQRIDGSFEFQTDPSKDYSLYIPSGYGAGTPHALMLGLHPLNTSRWNAVSWCDTLIVFAETNNLILACPDGGTDGRVDDPIDTAFTTALLDSMETWYDIDSEHVYAMGFSWGGRATYTYGLSNVERFAGFVPIGAAITGTDQVTGIIENAIGKPFYIVHGAFDSPNVRYHPIRNALIAEGALVNSILMAGVGHTIDFPNRNQILSDAFQWVAAQEAPVAAPLVGEHADPLLRLNLAPNPVERGQVVLVAPRFGERARLQVFDVRGRQVWNAEAASSFHLDTRSLAPGTYFLRAVAGQRTAQDRLVIR